MRILLQARSTSGNGLYRGVLPMSALMLRGHELHDLGGVARPRAVDFKGIDVLHVHRYCDQDTQTLMRRAREHGVAVVWDEDDDVLSFRGTLSYRNVSAVVWERRRAAIDRALQMADVVTTPSDELAERFRERGAKDVRVIENHVPRLFLAAQAPQARSGITIGWVAAAEHLYDAHELGVGGVLQRILDERPDVRS